MLIYIDDIILTGNNNQVIQQLIDALGCEFAIKDLGQLKYFLGFEVQHIQGGIVLSQSKYAKDLLTRTGLSNSSHFNTPMAIKTQQTD